MKFNIEVLLRDQAEVVDKVIHREGPEPRDWTDDDVREVLRLTLLSFDHVQNPDAEERTISLRGLSWIVTALKDGVAIAIEISSGAVVAGPFDIDADTLTASLYRVLARESNSSSMVH